MSSAHNIIEINGHAYDTVTGKRLPASVPLKHQIKHPATAPVRPGGHNVDGIHAAFFGYEYLKSGQYNAPWLPEVKRAFRNFLYIHGQPVEQAPNFFTKDKKTAALNFWNSVLGSDTGLRVLGSIIDNGVGVVRVSGEASRIDNPVRATSQWHKLRKRYGQVIAQHASHDALGHLSRARASANMSRILLDHFTDYLYSPEPRLVSLKDFQH